MEGHFDTIPSAAVAAHLFLYVILEIFPVITGRMCIVLFKLLGKLAFITKAYLFHNIRNIQFRSFQQRFGSFHPLDAYIARRCLPGFLFEKPDEV